MPVAFQTVGHPEAAIVGVHVIKLQQLTDDPTLGFFQKAPTFCSTRPVLMCPETQIPNVRKLCD